MATGLGIGGGSTHIATVQGRSAAANARLIAAVPEILQQLARLR